MRKVWGSSPLARGLPTPTQRTPATSGIIPARAGFTFPCTANSQPGKDHPRSRGVYRTHYRNQAHLLGSSPLARGLRRGCRGLRGRDRIIPARAGFTQPSSPSWNCSRDHPRSRGVYTTILSFLELFTGSSPLARGLPFLGDATVGDWRIIPARAGFTDVLDALPKRHADHPRSRGVYLAVALDRRLQGGSSPLARGLRKSCSCVRVRWGDHPRSRGVY